MAILQGDIQILASQSLTDTDSGGGAASGTAIVDGVSNNLFDDISQLDRTIGRVNLRKIFPAVRTTDTDGLFGTHVVVSDPPDDPNVSAVLLSTGDHYDQRPAAQSRIEAYLTQGPASSGLLFSNHVAGMQTVSILQRKSEPILSVGETILLRKAEGTASQAEQFFRITAVSYRDRQFTIPGNVTGETFSRTEVNYATSDPLRYDFPGFQAADSYRDSEANYTGKSRCYTTIVADAARYYGAVTLKTAAAISDSVIYADGIHTQLVPSAQIETAIPDARLNQQTAALVSAGAEITQTIYTSFSPSQAFFIGGGVLPGSLSVERAGITLTDMGGVLYNGAAQAGTIDYENGILSVTASLWSSAGNFAISYLPASAPTVVTRSAGIAVTAASQRRTFVVTIDPIPARKSLQVSYRSGGRWYVLQEDGSGAVRGGDSAFGAGSLNFDTGTLALTLGAMPDVGSQVIYAWSPTKAVETVTSTLFDDGALSLELSVPPIALGDTTITWNDGQARSASVSATGAVTGDATGTAYSWGRVNLVPNTLPTPTTGFTVTSNAPGSTTLSDPTLTDNGSSVGGTAAGAPLAPRSVELALGYTHLEREFPGEDATVVSWRRVFDDGAGTLLLQGASGSPVIVGTINYTTGVFSLQKAVAALTTVQKTFAKKVPGDASDASNPVYVYFTGTETRTVALTLDLTSSRPATPSWGWWSTAALHHARAVSSAGGVSSAWTVQASALTMSAQKWFEASRSNIDTVSFTIGSAEFRARNGNVLTNVSPLTGEGTAAGITTGGQVRLSTWPSGVTPQATHIRGTLAPSLSINPDLLTDGVVFRTAAAPVKSGGFSFTGTLKDGATVSATAAADGSITGTGVVGRIDYQTGVVQLRFGSSTSNSTTATGVIDVAYLNVAGTSRIYAAPVQADTLRYNAVAYTYIPLDADVLGLDPVRLPADGRVPVFRSGTVAVVQHAATTAPATVTNGQTVNVGRVRLARVRVIGNDGATIDNGYSADLDAGTVTFSNVTGYSQPVRVEHRIEDTALVSEAQIDGTLKLTRPVTHVFPIGSVVSSALVLGDMRAAVSKVFDQATWNDAWSDDLIGSAAAGTYDTINHPLSVTNLGSVTERWSLRFTGSTAFACYGEHLGLIAYGTTSSDFAPVNPATGQPYFTLPALGWGGGWSLGNALRINTEGAMRPVWVARVIKQGPATVLNDQFSLLVRGDIDTP